MKKNIVLLFLVLGCGLRVSAEPNNVMEVVQEENTQKTRLTLGPEMAMFSRSGKSLSSFVVHVGFEYALSDRLALGGALGQGFSSGGFLSPNFTKFSISTTYALTGVVVRKMDKVSLNNRKVFAADPYPIGGFRAHFGVSEYLFPITNGSLLFPAISLAASYEFPSSESYSLSVGLRGEYLFNANDTLTSFQPFIRVLLWI